MKALNKKKSFFYYALVVVLDRMTATLSKLDPSILYVKDSRSEKKDDLWKENVCLLDATAFLCDPWVAVVPVVV